MAVLLSVNIGGPKPNPDKDIDATGIDKAPQDGPIEVRDPGPKTAGLGSGLVGDYIGDGEHHGGSNQAVYAFGREDLDAWQSRLGRSLPNGFFGENLTTQGLDVNGALLGERWWVGASVELMVMSPRIPCSTFRGWVGEAGWLRTFTVIGRPGAYLRVVTPGSVRAGDAIQIAHRPRHQITITHAFRALTTERTLLPSLLDVGPDLDPELAALASG